MNPALCVFKLLPSHRFPALLLFFFLVKTSFPPTFPSPPEGCFLSFFTPPLRENKLTSWRLGQCYEDLNSLPLHWAQTLIVASSGPEFPDIVRPPSVSVCVNVRVCVCVRAPFSGWPQLRRPTRRQNRACLRTTRLWWRWRLMCTVTRARTGTGAVTQKAALTGTGFSQTYKKCDRKGIILPKREKQRC